MSVPRRNSPGTESYRNGMVGHQDKYCEKNMDLTLKNVEKLAIREVEKIKKRQWRNFDRHTMKVEKKYIQYLHEVDAEAEKMMVDDENNAQETEAGEEGEDEIYDEEVMTNKSSEEILDLTS